MRPGRVEGRANLQESTYTLGAQMKLEPGTVLGSYRIVSELGRGGMATVYKAYQSSLARNVAVKVLPEYFADEPGFKERFQQEAIAVANLRHRNIPAVHDYGETEGVTYIVSEYIDGGTLTEHLGQPVPLNYAIEVLSALAEALDYAHSKGVLHRDVKPSNVLLERGGTPVLADFGLAKIMASDMSRLTRTGTIVGTPEYMSPEQCEGDELTPAADLYALGVVAYEMLTGRPPFLGPTPLSVILAQVRDPLPPPRSLNPRLPESIEQVLIKALAKRPADRYASCTLFVHDLAVAAADADDSEATVDSSAEVEDAAISGVVAARFGSAPNIQTRKGASESERDSPDATEAPIELAGAVDGEMALVAVEPASVVIGTDTAVQGGAAVEQAGVLSDETASAAVEPASVVIETNAPVQAESPAVAEPSAETSEPIPSDEVMSSAIDKGLAAPADIRSRRTVAAVIASRRPAVRRSLAGAAALAIVVALIGGTIGFVRLVELNSRQPSSAAITSPGATTSFSPTATPSARATASPVATPSPGGVVVPLPAIKATLGGTEQSGGSDWIITGSHFTPGQTAGVDFFDPPNSGTYYPRWTSLIQANGTFRLTLTVYNTAGRSAKFTGCDTSKHCASTSVNLP